METHCDNPCLKRFWETWKSHKKFQRKNSKGEENDLLKDIQRSVSTHFTVEKGNQRKKEKKQNKLKKIRLSVSATSELPSLKVLEWGFSNYPRKSENQREKLVLTNWDNLKSEKNSYMGMRIIEVMSSDVGMDL